jgi:D-glycero-D-manno-heptose 1,7-bisphosphate phosphatase
MNKIKAIFFDRDGVVNLRIVHDYIKKAEEFRFLPDFLELYPKVIKAGYETLLITNQQGVSKGLMTLSQLEGVLDYMQNYLVNRFGRGFKDIFYCTDLAESGSYYRKPNPGMILEGIDKWNIDIAKSWMIGDSPTDSIAGKKAGLKTILIGDYKDVKEADFIVKDLYDLEYSVPIFK